MIREIIVVEGKDDISKVKAALDCEVIATGGFAFGKRFLNTLRQMEERRGVIILTDPDYMGNQIRKRLDDALDHPKHAFLPQSKARKKDNIGIENAKIEDIREAILKAKPKKMDFVEEFTRADLIRYDLTGKEGSTERRNRLSDRLGIGHGNAKQFLNRLNHFGITREELEKILEEVYHG
ncbi:ribonuclease M5 [Peptoniphilus sp. KCTC 25270]|uniref:ribonuclease M5 n=1 Tax=Peptoniphilus sp. KCTC 25270 TaxID=2897414 RepID=UPI001E48A49E|nr:ribonuclease M5 [Peptoniphilus sp. KCTC 25270]MCD1146752.1 ribonuclease M5 [Peptoniphilus sp. KCTC 25270]